MGPSRAGRFTPWWIKAARLLFALLAAALAGSALIPAKQIIGTADSPGLVADALVHSAVGEPILLAGLRCWRSSPKR